MSTSELFEFVKSDSIKNLICAVDIKTSADIEKRNAEGYMIGYTAEELKNVFPNIPPERIWYNNGFNKTFYYDNSNLVLFTINLFGRDSLTAFDELEKSTIKRAEELTRETRNGEYFNQLIVLNDKMRMEMLNRIIEQDRCPDAYSLFENFYQTSDYGCGELTLDSIRRLTELKTDEQKRRTREKISEFPDKVTIYRGEGDKSVSWQESVSWTTNVNTANFFASRFPSDKAVIHTAEVDKDKIIEYFGSEEECIVLPEDVRYIDSIKLQGLDFIENLLPRISDKYKYYRDLAVDELDFGIDDNEHGRLHTLRVLMNALALSDMKGLSNEETDILCTASIFHDTMRDNNGDDTKHGAAGAEYYREFAQTYPEYIEYSAVTEQLIKYHSLPDADGYGAIAKENHHLFDVFKDADALDRVRFGIKALDLNQLRTNEAKSLTMAANVFLAEIKIPIQTMEPGMNM